MAINLSVDWTLEPHQVQLRRAYPNEVYSSRAAVAKKMLSRIEYLRQMGTAATSVLPSLELEGVSVTSKSSPVDECDFYVPSTALRLRENFAMGAFSFSLKKLKREQKSYVGVIETGEEQQTLIIFFALNESIREIVVYRDKEDVRAVTTALRDITALSSYSSDAIRFIDNSVVTPEDLYWHYTEMKRKTDVSVLWSGVKFPLRVGNSDDLDTTRVETRIMRPYVHMTMTYELPVEVAGKMTLFVDTKHGVSSVHCEFPTDAVSIGVPALGDNSVLIVLFHCSQSLLQKVEVVAYNFPFWTPLSGALPLIDLPELPEIDDVDFSAFVGEAIKRQQHKRWIDGELEESPPTFDFLLPARLPFGALASFSLFHGTEPFTWSSINADGQTLLVLSQVKAPKLRIKKKWRFVCAYVLDGKAHKHHIKFKTTNVSGEPLVYSFNLPGPLRFWIELVDDGKRHYAVRTLYIDTLTKKEEVEDTDDDLWDRLL